MIKVKVIQSLLLLSFICHAAEAKITITKTKDRKPSSDTEAHLGSLTFLGFLRCGKSEKLDQRSVETCVSNFFSAKVSPGRMRGYMESLTLANEYSEPFYCSDETKNMVKAMETQKHDFYLCFKSDMTPAGSESLVFFVKERGMPRIVKLKL